MPGRNGMGPMGLGAATGRGRGGCKGAAPRDGFPTSGKGQGLGRGNGRGGGRHRHGMCAKGVTGWQRAEAGETELAIQPAAVKQQELAFLKQKAASVELALDELKARIYQLDTCAPAAAEKVHE